MNIAKSFVDYMIDQGFGTAFNTDVFIGGVPQEAPDTSWWVLSSGGSPILKNQTGEKKKIYQLEVFYRSNSGENVYNEMQSLEIELNKSNCIELAGFDTIEVEATIFPTDTDIDLEERTVGTIQVAITTYYKE